MVRRGTHRHLKLGLAPKYNQTIPIGAAALKSNRDPLRRFYCQAGNHPPQGNVDLHRFQHGGLPTLRPTLVGNVVSIAPVPMRKGSSPSAKLSRKAKRSVPFSKAW